MKRKIEELSDLKELSREDLVQLVGELSKDIFLGSDEFKDSSPFIDTEKLQVNYINSYLNVYHMHDNKKKKI